MKKCWLNDKTCVITGASSGIGRSLCEILINKHNCKVIGVGRNETKMIELKESLKDKCDNFSYRLFDVASEKDWQNFAKECKDEKIDIIINNAGILPPFQSVKNIDEKEISSEYKKVLEINFLSVVYGCKYFEKIIEKSETPAIINISSSASLCALAGTSIYSASKAATKSFTECLACEKPYYVGLVCPGFTKTNIFRNQTRDYSNKLIQAFCSELDKMSNKIYRGIKKKKRRMVYGVDAKAMDFMYRHFPKKTPRLFSNVIKKSKIDLFKDVF